MKILSIKYLLISSSIGLLFLFFGLSAYAQKGQQTIELKVHSENENKKTCPDYIIVTEQPHPYQEGSFATDGSVDLSAIASNISVAQSNSFSVTWVGTLKPKYAKCLASAGITKVNGQEYSEHTNYLQQSKQKAHSF